MYDILLLDIKKTTERKDKDSMHIKRLRIVVSVPKHHISVGGAVYTFFSMLESYKTMLNTQNSGSMVMKHL